MKGQVLVLINSDFASSDGHFLCFLITDSDSDYSCGVAVVWKQKAEHALCGCITNEIC